MKDRLDRLPVECNYAVRGNRCRKLPADRRVHQEMCVDLLRGTGQGLQVRERSCIFEAAEFSITHAPL